MSANSKVRWWVALIVLLILVPVSVWLGWLLRGPSEPPTRLETQFTDTCFWDPEADLNFGTVTVGTTNTLRFPLHNDSEARITIHLSASSDQFTLEPNGGDYTMLPQQTVVIAVTFCPDTLGPQRCRVSMGHSDLNDIICFGLATTGPTRSKYDRPFDTHSIWNSPIGSEADYVLAGFKPGKYIDIDRDHILSSGQRRQLLAHESWPNICEGDKFLSDVWVPDDYVVPSDGKNNAAAFILPDGEHIYQANPISRCEEAGPVYAGWAAVPEAVTSIYDDGLYGGHGGSSLSGIGGTIRLGELTSDEPIGHALKILVWAARYCTDEDGGFRWPAYRADAYALDPENPLHYNQLGSASPAVKMGSLLAIPDWVDISSLGLQTYAAWKIAVALQDYGAYIVDDSAWHTYYLCAEQGVGQEFQETYDLGIAAQAGPWYDDMMCLIQWLHVVDNNGPDTIGGGGTLRRPLAPPIGD